MTIRNVFCFDDLDSTKVEPWYHAGSGAITLNRIIDEFEGSFYMDAGIVDSSVDKCILSLLDMSAKVVTLETLLESISNFKDAIVNSGTKIPEIDRTNLNILSDDLIPIGDVYLTKGDGCTGCLLKKNNLYGMFCLPGSVLKYTKQYMS